jgi:hypothetical protein
MTSLHRLPRTWLARLYLAASCIAAMAVTWLEPQVTSHLVFERSGPVAWLFALLVALLSLVIILDAIGNDLLAGPRWLRVLRTYRSAVLIGLALCLTALAFVHATDHAHVPIARYVLHAVMAAGTAFFDLFERLRSPKE